MKQGPGEEEEEKEESAPQDHSKTGAAGKNNKKRVAKTLLFNSETLKEKAEAGQKQNKDAPAPVGPAQNAADKPQRKVPKTLLEIDTEAIMALAEAAAVEQDREKEKEQQTEEQKEQEQEQEQEKESISSQEDADAPPELNIDGPPVRLFFEDPLPMPPKPVRRRVAKTILFTKESLKPAAEKVMPGQRQISTKKIAKTLLFTGQDLPIILPQAAQDDISVSVPAEKVGHSYVAKTMLDHSILFAQLAKTQHRQEEKAIELAREKANEPFKPFLPIECKKNALPCNWTWDETSTNEKYRYCALCQLPVYNFAGLEIAEAEAIILKAENRSKFTLYKRSDGKFMTADCPQAIKKRSDFILLVAGSTIAVVCLLIYMVTLPKPKPKPAPPAMAKSGTVKNLVPAKKAVPGTGHYIAGKGIVMDAPAPTPALPPPVTAPASPDPDENGQMWEFSSPNK